MDTKLTITEDAPANSVDSSEDPYCLDPDFEVSPEELRRDRLAHLLLMGLRLVMEAEQEG
jgi:hypothetical protein